MVLTAIGKRRAPFDSQRKLEGSWHGYHLLVGLDGKYRWYQLLNHSKRATKGKLKAGFSVSEGGRPQAETESAAGVTTISFRGWWFDGLMTL